MCCSLCFISIGSVVKKFAAWNTSFFHDFLIGLALSNAFFTLVSIAYPVTNTVTFVFVLLVSGVGLVNADYVRQYYLAVSRQFATRVRTNPALAFLLLVFIGITFFQSLYSPSLHYDAGLYHIPVIKWTAEHKTIPGLVHLNTFLGYNFNSFSLDAAFYNLFAQPIYPLNFTIITYCSLYSFEKISSAFKLANYLLAGSYVLILYYLIQNFWPHVSTPSTDTLVFVLMILVLSSIVDIHRNRDTIFPILILSVYAITLKLSTAPVLLVVFYLLGTAYFWSRKKQALITLLSCGFIVFPWLAKNVILTGWLLFPFPAIDLFSPDWKLPKPDVAQLQQAIRAYYVPEGSSGRYGLQTWLGNQSGADLIMIASSAIAILVVVVRLFLNKRSLARHYVMALSVSVAGIIFMGIQAPSLRYGAAFFAALLLVSVQSLNARDTISKYGLYAFGLVVTCLFLKDNWFHPWHFTKHIAHRFLLPYPLEIPQQNQFAYFVVDTKVKCYYPIASDQCFDHPLPCASKRIGGLHLRGKRLEQGFYRDAR
ncbi:LIC_10190 family membrane protein [Spirosoma fluminis]